MKNTQQFTPFALETWVAALSIFDAAIVNRAVVEIGLNADPFPDLGKVFARCEQLRRKAAGTETQYTTERPSEPTIRKAAEAMGLRID